MEKKTAIIVPDAYLPLLEDIRLLISDENNPNRTTIRQQEQIWMSLQKYGWAYPIITSHSPQRAHIEAVNSFLKTQYSMASNKVRGLKQVTSYALYNQLCLDLNRETAENIGRADKAVSPTYFNT